MLHNFGRVHSLPHTKGGTDFQVNYIAERPTKSVIVITMAADDLRIVNRISPGRIVSAFMDTFEALSTTGLLMVFIQNTGSFTAIYNVSSRVIPRIMIFDRSLYDHKNRCMCSTAQQGLT